MYKLDIPFNVSKLIPSFLIGRCFQIKVKHEKSPTTRLVTKVLSHNSFDYLKNRYKAIRFVNTRLLRRNYILQEIINNNIKGNSI